MSGRDLVFTILGIDRGSQAFDKVGNSAERMGNRIDKAGNLAIKSMLGVEAAGIASGVAIAGALAGAPALFGAIAAVAVSSNKDVQESFKNLASEVKSDVKALAEPLAGDFVDIANDLSVAWEQRFAPALRMAFTDPRTKSGIKDLTAGVTDLASNALPGLMSLLVESEPAVKGLRSAMADTGTGFTEFARNISESSDSAGRIVTGFGRITSDALGDVGSLLGKLADSVAPHMGEIERLFDQSTDSVLGLATNALPILTSASGATMGVLNSVLGVLEPISGQLGTGLGLTLAAAGGWRVLSGAGNAFTKLDLGGRLENTALKAGVMAESLTGSATAGERVATAGSKMATVLRGVDQAIPFVGVAAVAASLALDAMARHTQEATERGGALAKALIKGGSEADQARKRLAGLNGENVKLQASFDALTKKQHEAGQAGVVFNGQINELQVKLNDNHREIGEARSGYQKIKDSLTGAQLAQVQYNEAVERHGSKSTEAAAAGAALRAEIDKESESQRSAANAVKTHTDRLVEQQNVKLGAVGAEINYRQAVLGVDQAQKALTETLAKHSATSLEGRGAIIAYEGALHQAVTAAREMSLAETVGQGDSERAAAAHRAGTAEVLRLAAAAGTSAPPALQQMVAGLDATTLAAIGVTGRINETGQAVYRLPDGREIVITGNTEEAKRKIDEINAKQVYNKLIYVDLITRADSKISQGLGGMARGGVPEVGRPIKVNEEGREAFVPTTPGVIIPHSATVALARAGRLGQGSAKVEKHYHLTVVNAGNSEIDLRAQFERLELVAFPEGG